MEAGGPPGSCGYQSLALLPLGLSQQLPNQQNGRRGPPPAWPGAQRGSEVSAPGTGVGSLAGHQLRDLEPGPLGSRFPAWTMGALDRGYPAWRSCVRIYPVAKGEQKPGF